MAVQAQMNTSSANIEHHLDSGRRRVCVSGEINARTGPTLTRLLGRICPDFGEIELDLHAVTFIDTHGLWTLLNAKAICAEHCAELALIPPGSTSRRQGQRRHAHRI